MLVRISEHCMNCDTNDRGKYVDAIPQFPEDEGNSAFVYYSSGGIQWYLNQGDFEPARVLTATPGDLSSVNGEF